MRLDGKVAIVTGATMGIGVSIVERLAEEGASVVFTGRTLEKGKEVEAGFRARGLETTFVQGSVTEDADVKAAVETAVGKYGRLTTLVNNAAATDTTGPGGLDSHITEISWEAFDKVIRTGVHSLLLTCRHSIPHMIEAGGGSIINISAASSLRAIDGRPAYQASKGAVNTLTRQIAVDYGVQGVRSNAIVVGFTPTGGEVMTKMLNTPAFITAVKKAIPSPRLGHPRDIGNGCVYLASDEAEYVNGVLLPIDGGLSCKLGIPDTSALSAIAGDS
ncbi:MAG: SDR family oxidoreductase [Actinomycetota bacterium]|nr:SDR family oxidoreductase [Actinomycetota bacterium]